MKKTLIAVTIASMVLVGCGDNKTPEQIKFEQETKLLSMKQAHEREMARIENEGKKQNGNPYSEQQQTQYDDSYVGEQQVQREIPIQRQVQVREEQPYDNYSRNQQPVAEQQQTNDSGSSDGGLGWGSVALGVGAGAIAAYAATELLNNGMKSYKDDRGNTHYTDKDGKPVTKAAYEDHKKKNPKTTMIQEKAAGMKQSVSNGAANMKTKAVETKDRVANSPTTQNFKGRMQQKREAVKQAPTYKKTQQQVRNTQQKSSFKKRR